MDTICRTSLEDGLWWPRVAIPKSGGAVGLHDNLLADRLDLTNLDKASPVHDLLPRGESCRGHELLSCELPDL